MNDFGDPTVGAGKAIEPAPLKKGLGINGPAVDLKALKRDALQPGNQAEGVQSTQASLEIPVEEGVSHQEATRIPSTDPSVRYDLVPARDAGGNPLEGRYVVVMQWANSSGPGRSSRGVQAEAPVWGYVQGDLAGSRAWATDFARLFENIGKLKLHVPSSHKPDDYDFSSAPKQMEHTAQRSSDGAWVHNMDPTDGNYSIVAKAVAPNRFAISVEQDKKSYDLGEIALQGAPIKFYLTWLSRVLGSRPSSSQIGPEIPLTTRPIDAAPTSLMRGGAQYDPPSPNSHPQQESRKILVPDYNGPDHVGKIKIPDLDTISKNGTVFLKRATLDDGTVVNIHLSHVDEVDRRQKKTGIKLPQITATFVGIQYDSNGNPAKGIEYEKDAVTPKYQGGKTFSFSATVPVPMPQGIGSEKSVEAYLNISINGLYQARMKPFVTPLDNLKKDADTTGRGQISKEDVKRVKQDETTGTFEYKLIDGKSKILGQFVDNTGRGRSYRDIGDKDEVGLKMSLVIAKFDGSTQVESLPIEAHTKDTMRYWVAYTGDWYDFAIRIGRPKK